MEKPLKIISSLAAFLLLAGMLTLVPFTEPASASTKLTVTLSGNVDKSFLDNYINKLKSTYRPDEIIIKYSNGKVCKYAPDSKASPKPVPVTQTPKPEPDKVAADLTADEQKMLNLINQERAKEGLSPLKPNSELVRLARLKAKDMISKGYFSHTSPTYGSPFDMMKSAGVSYRYAGENLAGASGVETAHKNLMNSPGHKANILNKSFTEVGIGIIDGGPYGKMFVQMFKG